MQFGPGAFRACLVGVVLLSHVPKHIRRLWRARVRRIDVEEIWPHIKGRCTSTDQAKLIFTDYVSRSRAWRGYDLYDIVSTVDKLQ